MMKIIVRSGLPLWYTEGFNPKPKLTFAAPLSIGTESVVEFMDIKLTERVPEEEVARVLNLNMTEEMKVLEAYYPESKLPTLSFLGYLITLDLGVNVDSCVTEIQNIFSMPTVEIVKKTKSGERMTDIKPMIKSFSVIGDGNKILIRGNHDASTIGLENYFSEVRELKTITFKKTMFPFLEENMTCVLCHFPLFTWDRRTHGSIMVHGHCHGGIDRINHESKELRVDVGIDGCLCEFVRFVELEDLYNYMKTVTEGQTFQEYIDKKMEKDGFKM
jgi:radical SAM-linked protein